MSFTRYIALSLTLSSLLYETKPYDVYIIEVFLIQYSDAEYVYYENCHVMYHYQSEYISYIYVSVATLTTSCNVNVLLFE